MVEIVQRHRRLTDEELFGLALQEAFDAGRLPLDTLMKFLNETNN